MISRMNRFAVVDTMENDRRSSGVPGRHVSQMKLIAAGLTSELRSWLRLKVRDFLDPDHLIGPSLVRNSEVGDGVAWNGGYNQAGAF